MLPSILSIFKIAVGPSSSHTLGPCLCANHFLKYISQDLPDSVVKLQVVLLGSLSLTGKGHLTDIAITAGLSGFNPEVNPEQNIQTIAKEIAEKKSIYINSKKLEFDPEVDIIFSQELFNLPHPNTLIFQLLDAKNTVVNSWEYYSLGGGKISGKHIPNEETNSEPNLFPDMSSIMRYCVENKVSIIDFIFHQEEKNYHHSKEFILNRMHKIWYIMANSVENGLDTLGVLPGELKLQRRARNMYDKYLAQLREWKMLSREITLASIYAIACAEENAAGGLIVTAPTCGSAGIIPAVIRMLKERYHFADENIYQALMVAGLFGAMVVQNASIAGAEVGCQGEVGVASSMAAAAACFLLGGTLPQIESAAETALEHFLGLTCDPVHGLVQIPCIERNSAGAVNALNASNLAFMGTGSHRISFDNAVTAMKQIGFDMSHKYKETSLGGLATIWQASECLRILKK